jgi:hypothetical protein
MKVRLVRRRGKYSCFPQGLSEAIRTRAMQCWLHASEGAVDIRKSEVVCCRAHYRFCNFCGGTSAATELTPPPPISLSLTHTHFLISQRVCGDDSRGYWRWYLWDCYLKLKERDKKIMFRCCHYAVLCAVENLVRQATFRHRLGQLLPLELVNYWSSERLCGNNPVGSYLRLLLLERHALT